MSDAVWWELLIMVPGSIFAGYAIAWSVPGVIMSATVSLGSFNHIIFIDKQLAKGLDKYYDKKKGICALNIKCLGKLAVDALIIGLSTHSFVSV